MQQRRSEKIGNIRTFVAVALGVAMLCTVGSLPAKADEYEMPKPIEPAKIHGRKAFGANYQLQNPVLGDGVLRFYKLSTFYGSIAVIGDELLKVRFKELAALQFLDELKLDPEFNRKFDHAIENSLSFTQGPFSRLRTKSQGTTSGVDMMFRNIGESARKSDSKSQEKGLSSIDVSRARRHIAYHLNVDPYTDFLPLSKQLNHLSRAGDTAVDLIATALGAVKSGGRGLFKSRGKASELQVLVRDKTPSQLKDYNQKILIGMDIDEGLVDRFLSNSHFSISDQTALSIALKRLDKVSHRHIFLQQAAFAAHREVAYLYKRSAELFADFHERKSPIKEFVSLAKFPFAHTEEGKLLGIFVVDELVWTPVVAQAIRSINSSAQAQKFAAGVDLYITGTATKLAKSNLEQLKWKVFTQTKFN